MSLNKPSIVRCTGIDLLRLICAFLVICIHCSFKWQNYVLPLARTAVPVFFMISGYFYSSGKNGGQQFRQIKKVLKLIVLSALIYIVCDIVRSFLLSCDVVSAGLFLRYAFGRLDFMLFKMPEAWANFLLFNEPPFGAHLWYLSAFLYVLLIIVLTERFIDRRRLYFLIPLLLAASLFIGSYSKAIFRLPIPAHMYRNFIFTGLPFFLLGDFLRGFEGRNNIGTKALCAALPLSLALIYAENAVLKKINHSISAEFFIGTIIMAATLLLLAERELALYDNKLIKTLARWGRQYSLGIYISHMLLMDVFFILNHRLHIHSSNAPSLSFLVTPVYVFAADLLLLMLWRRIRRPRKSQ